jgi:uncharacterized protein (DUF1810 family)
VPHPNPYDLQRFIAAQQGVIDEAIAELRAGTKHSHWMWFVFPQLAELGRSPTAKLYGIASLDEARAYLRHPLLGSRLRQSVDALLPWSGRRSAEQILGSIDAMKLCSSATLFDCAEPEGKFHAVLLNFCNGKSDKLTLALLERGK